MTPEMCEKARQCVSLRVNAVLGGGAARVPTPKGPETDSPETRGPSPETTMPGGDPVYSGKAWHRAMQGGWVGFEMKPQVWVKARSKTANA